MEREKSKNGILGHPARVSYPDESRRRFLRLAGLGTLSMAAAASRAHAADAELASPPVPPRTGGHERYMRRAIALAKQVPAFPFGAVIVRRATGVIVAEGHNRSSESPSFHGEIVAINRCAADHPSIDWTELDLHTTAEPCPMCQGAIEWAGIPTVYYGTSIPHLQQLGWQQIEIRAEEVARRTPFRQSTVIGGILAEECNALFEAAPASKYRC
ncbi:MAG: nucleoside deaminase [Gammaproteobacteria bacterium]